MPAVDQNSSSIIEIDRLRKTYVDRQSKPQGALVVLEGLSLRVRRGEFLTIFGPNGCGKSTLLHILAGLASWDEGTVQIDGEEPGAVNVGFVFQNFQATLFPWKRNLDNVAWPLELRGVARETRRKRTREFLNEMGIHLPERGYPYQLSGGQQQLLSIARALIGDPKVLLMDEPFNQLDYQTRMGMHLKTLELWARTGTSVLFVSHDIEEALFLGDRTAMLSRRPAKVLEILENPLPRPRTHELLKSSEFFNLKARALEVFATALAE